MGLASLNLCVTTEDRLALSLALSLVMGLTGVQIRPVCVILSISHLLCITTKDALALSLAPMMGLASLNLSIATEDGLALAFTLALVMRSTSVEISPVSIIFGV
jgi:hypothetical protein